MSTRCWAEYRPCECPHFGSGTYKRLRWCLIVGVDHSLFVQAIAGIIIIVVVFYDGRYGQCFYINFAKTSGVVRGVNVTLRMGENAGAVAQFEAV